MARVKRGVTAHAKHKKVLEQAKGFYGRRKNTIRTAKAAVDKAGQYAYRDRRVKKRTFRYLWQIRINSASTCAAKVLKVDWKRTAFSLRLILCAISATHLILPARTMSQQLFGRSLKSGSCG